MCLGSLDVRKIRRIKSILASCMDDLIENHRDILCRNPVSDFTRERDFTARKTISTLLRFESKTSESDLIDILNCEKSARNINAAFLQQRRKLTDRCFPFLFRSFTEAVAFDKTPGFKDRLCHGMHLLAGDGSDVNVAYNPRDPLTYIEQKGEQRKHLGILIHIQSFLSIQISTFLTMKKKRIKYASASCVSAFPTVRMWPSRLTLMKKYSI